MPNTLPGLDALMAGYQFRLHDDLKSRKSGLLTNQTGLTRSGIPAWEALRDLGFNILALFSPEHGPRGVLEGEIDSSKMEDGTPIHSLYGKTRRPTAEMLEGLDVIICDLQDVGARFYTYAATVFEILEACAPLNISVVILDRPNPLGDPFVEGPLIDEDLMSFIGPAPLPITHGMTLGELALFYRGWKKLDVEIEVVRVKNWHRGRDWNSTGLEWRRPSPNLPNFTSAAWYPGLCLLEFSGLSVGRGTHAPFQILGSPNFKAISFIEHFHNDEGINAEIIEFTPTHSVFEGQLCRGILFSHATLPTRPVEFGLCVMVALRASHPDFPREDWDKANKLLGSRAVLEALWDGNLKFAREKSRADAAAFRETRQRFLLY